MVTRINMFKYELMNNIYMSYQHIQMVNKLLTKARKNKTDGKEWSPNSCE